MVGRVAARAWTARASSGKRLSAPCRYTHSASTTRLHRYACGSWSASAQKAQVLEEFARRLTNKVVHAPTQALNNAGDAERAELLLLLHRIYHLSDSCDEH